jgi:hypothetical protein
MSITDARGGLSRYAHVRTDEPEPDRAVYRTTWGRARYIPGDTSTRAHPVVPEAAQFWDRCKWRPSLRSPVG